MLNCTSFGFKQVCNHNDRILLSLWAVHFVGVKKQAHVVYNVYTGTPEKKPPPDPDPEPIAVKVEIEALKQKLEAEKEISRVKLHEATSAARQTVNQHMLDTVAERVNTERLREALLYENASTYEIRKRKSLPELH